ncbi:unnamed protein product [Cuscuta campestris]|uniref:Retrotransposon gag domain-containing protein n=1 Tax=Cuscuta campestris TaxID=132261 RepID=A0A484N8D6_9ASTE|nr:unnamed protein product [Cuscuta campestris]
MSHTSQTLTKEDLVASNAELKAQLEYLAKQVAQLTKFKMSMVNTPEESKDEPNDFIDWLDTIEHFFDFKDIEDDKKVKLIALKFRGYASTWWTNITTKRRREGKAAIKTWTKMKALLKKKFIPTHYIRENFARLQNLRQGNRSVEEYNREFEELLMRCNLQENDLKTSVRYLFGLNTQIANTVELHVGILSAEGMNEYKEVRTFILSVEFIPRELRERMIEGFDTRKLMLGNEAWITQRKTKIYSPKLDFTQKQLT